MPRSPRRQPSRLRQTWVQWTRDAIREARLDPDVSRQWEEASTIFAGILGEASATVEDLARFDEAIARLARLIRSRPLQINEVWGPHLEPELSSLIRGGIVYRTTGRLPSGGAPHRTHHLSANNPFTIGPDGLLRGHFEARPEHWDEVRDHFTASPYLKPGPTPGSGHYPTPERLRAAVVQTMRQLLAHGDELTRAEVAYHLPRRISERWLRTLLKKYRLSWDELRREAEQNPPSSPGTK